MYRKMEPLILLGGGRNDQETAQIKEMLQDVQDRTSRIETLEATDTERGMVKLCSREDVTESAGLALPASEKNSAVQGTLAHRISLLDRILVPDLSKRFIIKPFPYTAQENGFVQCYMRAQPQRAYCLHIFVNGVLAYGYSHYSIGVDDVAMSPAINIEKGDEINWRMNAGGTVYELESWFLPIKKVSIQDSP